MLFFGLFFLFFGMTIIAFPDIIAYMIGFFFFFLGVTILSGTLFSRKSSKGSDHSNVLFSINGYDFIRNKKK